MPLVFAVASIEKTKIICRILKSLSSAIISFFLTSNVASQKLLTEFSDSLETRSGRYRYHLNKSMQASQGTTIGLGGVQIIQIADLKKKSTIDTLSFTKEKVKNDFVDVILYKKSLLGKANVYRLEGVEEEQLEFTIKVKKEIMAGIVLNRMSTIKNEKFKDEKSVRDQSRDDIFIEAFIRYETGSDPAVFLLSLPRQSKYEAKVYFNSDSLSFRAQPRFKKEKMNGAGKFAGIEVVHNGRAIAGIDHSSDSFSFFEEIIIDNQLGQPNKKLAISAIVIFLETMEYAFPYGW